MNINLGLQGNTKNYLASTTKKPNVPFSSIFISRIPSLLEEHLCPQTSSQWFKQLKWFYATFSIIKIYFASFVFQGICWNQDSPSNRMFAKVTGLRQKWKATQYHRQKDFRITKAQVQIPISPKFCALGKLASKSASYLYLGFAPW